MEPLKRLNGWIYRAERAIVVSSLLVMSAVMFLTVVHRNYANEESTFVGKLASWVLGAERGDPSWETAQQVAGWLLPLGLAAVVYGGFRTASRRPLLRRPGEPEDVPAGPRSHLQCLGLTAATVGVTWGLLVLLFGSGAIGQSECIELAQQGDRRLTCGLFPEGLRWATSFSLVLTLWVAFIGASMATHDNLHLKLEAANKALPEKLRRITGLLAGLVTATLCGLLAYLGVRYIGAKYDEYQISGGLGGRHDSTPIPYFLSFLIVPLAWVLMGARFIGLGVLAFRGQLSSLPQELRELEHKQHDQAAPGGEVTT